MVPENLRRSMAAHPELPQCQIGVEGGMGWFTAAEVATLRAHFMPNNRRARYAPPALPKPAPLVTLTAPLGKGGCSTLLRQAEGGVPVADLSSGQGISITSF